MSLGTQIQIPVSTSHSTGVVDARLNSEFYATWHKEKMISQIASLSLLAYIIVLYFSAL